MTDEQRRLLWAQKLVACFNKDGSLNEDKVWRMLFRPKDRKKDVCVADWNYAMPQVEWDYYMAVLFGRDMFDEGWVYDDTRSCYEHTKAAARFVVEKYEEKQRAKKKE